MINVRYFIFNPFMEMTYVVNDENKNAIIIDCGCSTEHERQKLLNYIEHNQLHPIGLLNTHFHLDHQFGNTWINKIYGLIPYGSEQDKPLLDTIPQQYELFGIQQTETTIRNINSVTDGQIFRFGKIAVDVIATPGHTPGSVCYLLKSNDTDELLFSGDTLFAGSIGRTDLPFGNYKTLINSLQRLAKLPDTIHVYPGHGMPTTIGYEKQHNPFMPYEV